MILNLVFIFSATTSLTAIVLCIKYYRKANFTENENKKIKNMLLITHEKNAENFKDISNLHSFINSQSKTLNTLFKIKKNLSVSIETKDFAIDTLQIENKRLNFKIQTMQIKIDSLIDEIDSLSFNIYNQNETIKNLHDLLDQNSQNSQNTLLEE